MKRNVLFQQFANISPLAPSQVGDWPLESLLCHLWEGCAAPGGHLCLSAAERLLCQHQGPLLPGQQTSHGAELWGTWLPVHLGSIRVVKGRNLTPERSHTAQSLDTLALIHGSHGQHPHSTGVVGRALICWDEQWGAEIWFPDQMN